MAAPRKEKAYEKHAWIILFLEVGIFGLLFGSYLTLMGTLNLPYPDSQEPKYYTGMTWDELVARSPDIASYISQFLLRNDGIGSLFFTAVTMAMIGISYRKGERWAWYVSWVVPAYYIFIGVASLQVGGSAWPVVIVLLIISLLGLLLPYRKSFPKKPPQQ